MKTWIAALAVGLFAFNAAAKGTMKFNYRNEDVIKLIEDYSQASGQKFVVDPGVRGKVTVMNPDSISIEDGFNQLSMALATNGIAISKQGDVMMVSAARNVQRNLIDVGTDLPPLKPEKMYTWIINLKFIRADDINKQIRILTSSNGELVPFQDRNQLIVTDWVSNLHRISAILAQLDKPARAGASGKTTKAKAAADAEAE